MSCEINSVSFKKWMAATLSVTKTNPYFEGSKAAINNKKTECQRWLLQKRYCQKLSVSYNHERTDSCNLL